ncbi:pheromone processing endoprotease KexB [Cordyceps fumosorosea ARSEF 2679]|uniref:Pheromone processing endoprotease KexB n=1 Tax=Cordyceps fumosorosea (strain ARSEF 2679) TaxID=1081104 RepID=A0A162MW83_CORFA|nr:pheromone processing endoprotease KexB [Cordyceps fumosorosea ARSEF 2679]OAA71569.1 pheromone processing endoprotease KexB [Cordyceps fumosorosea ARSEF 2679]
MKITALLGLFGLAAVSTAHFAPDYDANDYYVLHLDEGVQPDHVADRLGLRHEGPLGALDHHYIFRSPKYDHDVVKPQLLEWRRRKRDGSHDILDTVRLARKQQPRTMLQKRIPPPPLPHAARASQQPNAEALTKQKNVMQLLSINDPTFPGQWHLFNPVQLGHDVNVTGAWVEGVTGKNVTVAIVDDGLDMHSLDLKDNYFAEGSKDYNDPGQDPSPKLPEDGHGTRCAGEVAAVKNDVCGVGVAYDAKVAGIRILSKPISDMDEAQAMIYEYQKNQIYSCSWGPPDDGRSMEAPGILIRRAMLEGIQKGRHGLGTIYVFASGNGAASEDNCNFDGYTNSIYSITVGAVDREGNHPYYSEHCSAQLVVTYSSGSGDSIHTTDVGTNKCTISHGGTSAAAPLAAGIFALVMQVRPELTWRDLQYLALETAVKVDDPNADWNTTAIGKHFSHTFGYGKIDSYSIVQMARTWKQVKPQAWYFSPWIHVKTPIPQGNEGVTSTFEVTQDMLTEANLERLEHVTVTMNVDHTRRGDLSVDLVSPEGFVSHIATTRRMDSHGSGYVDWTFMSVAHWGEKGVGKWTVIVRDSNVNQHSGKFVDWRLKLWGESIDAGKASLLPMPTENDDVDHDKVETVTIPGTTTSVPPQATSEPSPTVSVPDDHINRPTKPAGGDTAPSPTTTTPASTPVDQKPAESSPSSNWISWLPSFGASKTAQIWIYGAAGLIGAFGIGLGIFFYIARRRRLRNDSRSNYEFELLDEEEGGRDGAAAGGIEKGLVSGKSGRRTRGGELYDAFADGSSEDEESDADEFDAYRDRSADRLAGVEHLPEDEEQHVIGDESEDEDDAAVDEKAGQGRALTK